VAAVDRHDPVGKPVEARAGSSVRVYCCPTLLVILGPSLSFVVLAQAAVSDVGKSCSLSECAGVVIERRLVVERQELAECQYVGLPTLLATLPDFKAWNNGQLHHRENDERQTGSGQQRPEPAPRRWFVSNASGCGAGVTFEVGHPRDGLDDGHDLTLAILGKVPDWGARPSAE